MKTNKQGKRLMCMSCRKVYNSRDEIETKPDGNIAGLILCKEICTCGAVNNMRPEAYWTEEDKKKIKEVEDE